MEITYKRDDKDLSVQYVSHCQKDRTFDTVQNALLDATTLTSEEIDALGFKEAQRLYKELIATTFKEESEGDGENEGKQ